MSWNQKLFDNIFQAIEEEQHRFKPEVREQVMQDFVARMRGIAQKYNLRMPEGY